MDIVSQYDQKRNPDLRATAKLEFMEALNELTKEYNIEIGGCGDCGSPWLWDNITDKEVGTHLTYNTLKETYSA